MLCQCRYQTWSMPLASPGSSRAHIFRAFLLHINRWPVIWGLFFFFKFEPELQSMLLFLFAKWFFKSPVLALLCFSISVQKHLFLAIDIWKNVSLCRGKWAKGRRIDIVWRHQENKCEHAICSLHFKKCSHVFSNPCVSMDWEKSRSSWEITELFWIQGNV